MKKLLLISNSTNAGEAYLGWPRNDIKNFLNTNKVSRVLFVPYAGVSVTYDDYTNKVADVFKELGVEIYGIHNEIDPVKAVKEAEAIAVGGGNTFHLLYMLHKLKLVDAIRDQALKGVPYMGWSAGSNVACPSLKTTNDMPIIEPAGFDCAALVPFQINPHYLDAHPDGHGGETREQRIEEFLKVNQQIYVVGLREATLLLVEGDKISLIGKRPMRVFKYGEEPKEIQVGENIDFLLKA
ncbi:MAG: dipeptidase PepE [Bacteroidota bacterium]